ncbi:MAG: 2OG-Fe(II) oxygenase family protein, partial [Micropepsaceae bacterium]
LRMQIRDAISRYIAAMPDDPDHPFFSRKSKSFAFSGSWSVCLREGGFHTNHIHPKGWISSAYYVSVPQEAADERNLPGWFKMGETNLQLGRHERIQRLVQPKVGQLVLFPSYFWHGTVPFQSDSERLTVAFDVVPA